MRTRAATNYRMANRRKARNTPDQPVEALRNSLSAALSHSLQSFYESRGKEQLFRSNPTKGAPSTCSKPNWRSPFSGNIKTELRWRMSRMSTSSGTGGSKCRMAELLIAALGNTPSILSEGCGGGRGWGGVKFQARLRYHEAPKR